MPDDLSLREAFKSDFGVDIPVSGSGGGPDSPFTIVANDVQHAVDVQAAVLNYLAMGMQMPWCFLSQEVLGSAPIRTRVRIHVLEVTVREIAIETRRYYFNWDGPASTKTVGILPLPTGFIDPRSGIALPYELGWFHFSSTKDLEDHQPGLGMTVQYEGMWAKASIFIYDSGRPVDPIDRERIDEEFRLAVNGVLSAVHGSTLLSTAALPAESSAPVWRCAEFSAPDEMGSVVLLTSLRGCFLKARVTWRATDRQLVEVAHQAIHAILMLNPWLGLPPIFLTPRLGG